MFRLVKIPEMPDVGSAFFLLCDQWQCMQARRGPVKFANAEEYRLVKRAFLKTAIDEGWWIDLEGTFCPPHAREMIYAARKAEENGKQIVEPLAAHVAAFGRSR